MTQKASSTLVSRHTPSLSLALAVVLVSALMLALISSASLAGCMAKPENYDELYGSQTESSESVELEEASEISSEDPAREIASAEEATAEDAESANGAGVEGESESSPDNENATEAESTKAASEPAVATPDSSPNYSPSDLVVRFIDVGEGDCALVSCGGEWMLIDGGWRKNSGLIYSILEREGVRDLSAVIISHPDADHVGGVAGALSYATCDVCFCSTTTDESYSFNKVAAMLDEQGCPITVPFPGDAFRLGDATVTFIGPVAEYEYDNDSSLVFRIEYGSTSFLFTSDISWRAEKDLVEAGAHLNADVLKVAHHGSSWSSRKDFLKLVSPDIAVISVGADNDNNHPADSVLKRLAKLGVQVYRTDLNGDITISSNGTELSVWCAKN